MKLVQSKNINPSNTGHISFLQKEKTDSFFIKNKPFFNSTSIQAKLTVGQPNDPYEKEADVMADKVAQRLSDTSFSNVENDSKHFFNKSYDPIQRKCRACENEEEKLQTKPAGPPQFAPAYIESGLNSSRGNGSSLPSVTRMQMENSFGADFSNVRVHTGSYAVQMSKDLNAQAFTHGTDIYFNEGKFNPGTKTGSHLLAHELTHVMQQGNGSRSLQCVPGDKHDLTATELSGDPVLEQTFDNETVVGKFSNSRGAHVQKIQEGLIRLGIELPQSGADEKYGTETENAVKNFQQKASMSRGEQDGIVGRKTIGLLDRSLRNNSIATDTDEAKNDFTVTDPKKDEACKNKPTSKACPDPNSTVKAAADQAIAMVDKVLDEQLPPVKNKKADYPNIFTRIFRNNDSRDISFTVDEVKKNYIEIKKFIARLKNENDLVRCATDCDGGCRSGSPAYHSPTKEGKHIITFCPDFEKHKERILIVLHECHHAAIPGSSDKAYEDTRLFDQLDHTKALLNAASFHVYAAWVDTPGSQPIGPGVKDTNLINDKTEKRNVDMSLAFLQQWLKLVPFDVSQTVQGTQEAKEQGKYVSNNARVFMEVVFSKWFGLTSPPAIPNDKDIKKLQAIDERIKKMREAFKVPFVIVETKDQSFWARGPGPDIALNEKVLKLNQDHMIIALLQELIHATPDISAETEPLYAGTINDMRNLRKLDP